jgi:hypothetical protein
MGLFKIRKNKKFNYEPRFYKGGSSPFEIKHKFDDQRVTIKKTNLKETFNNAIDDLKNRDKQSSSIIGIIALVLLFLFFWFMDFDLTIFYS